MSVRRPTPEDDDLARSHADAARVALAKRCRDALASFDERGSSKDGWEWAANVAAPLLRQLAEEAERC